MICAGAAAVLCVAAAGCKNQGGASGGGEILIGEYGSMTGSEATFGKSTDNGIQMAVEEVNAKGGVLGKQVRVQLEDDGGRPDQAITAVQKLISSDNALAILGEVASSNSLAAAPVCQNAKVPMISPSSTNPKVTQVGNYIFRTCFTDPFQASVCAGFAKDHLKAKKAGIFTDLKSDYSQGLSKYFIQAFGKIGGQTKQVFYSKGDKDFRAQLTSLQGFNPDVIFIPGYYTDVGNIAVQARSIGLKQPLMGGDGWDSPKLVEIGKSAIQGAYFSTHYSPQSDDPRVQTFVRDYKKKYGGQTPDALAAVAYDAAKILLDAIQRSGATEPTAESRAKLRDALAATKNFPGVTGDITINSSRDAVKPAAILQVKGQEYSYVTTVKP
jgi:branched-chain amino acid transport system substrate-binding protein